MAKKDHQDNLALAQITVDQTDSGLVLRASGEWVLGALDEVDKHIRDLDPVLESGALVDVSAVARLDTAGAWLLQKAARAVGLEGSRAQIVGATDNHSILLNVVAEVAPEPIKPIKQPPAAVAAVARLGAGLEELGKTGVELIALLGFVLSALGGTLIGRRRFRYTSTVHQIEATALDAVPIIALINFLIGAVIAFMTADILAEYGGEIFSIDLIAFAFLREFGVLLSAILVAGRSGSAFTAEIGAMKGHEEIDAMRALALDPVEILVLPRVVALIIALPILTFIADMMGLAGGMLVAWAYMDFSPSTFASRLLEVTAIDHFWVGMIKAPFFAVLIALIGCYQGFKVTGSAESVGERTTVSVVQSIFIVVIVDAIFAMFFLEINY